MDQLDAIPNVFRQIPHVLLILGRKDHGFHAGLDGGQELGVNAELDRS
jgi:hypothetical protein